ncbi:hypothetical protein ABT344_14940 [Micromonospora carbonacea]|uniref:hypothetical protein n=1 Tax=Micromonospora carbonacea TaxID=47853 RepID=UPI00332B0D7E
MSTPTNSRLSGPVTSAPGGGVGLGVGDGVGVGAAVTRPAPRSARQPVPPDHDYGDR